MRLAFLLLLLTALLALSGCAGFILPGGDGGGGGAVPTAAQTITFDGAITVSVKNGGTLPGTNLGYQGKSADGRALLLVNGQQAAKQLADSVYYSGAPVPGATLRLSTRVGTYDQNAVNLIGTVHVEVQDPHIDANMPAQDQITAFGIPVQYSVGKGQAIPGTFIQYLGQTQEGAQFSNIGEFPYRQQFDSVVWNGHLRDKVALRLDLRLISSSDESAALVGTAQIRFEK